MSVPATVPVFPDNPIDDFIHVIEYAIKLNTDAVRRAITKRSRDHNGR